MKGWPARSEVEPILTIAPSIPSRIMIFTASCIRKKGARTFTANIRSKSSTEVFSRLPRSLMPAALTRMSTRPKRASVSAMTRRTSSMMPRSAPTTCTGTALSASIPSATVRPFAASRPDDDDPCGPGLGEEPRDGRAHSLGAAGDDGHLSVDAVHCTTSYSAAAMTRRSSAWPFLAISSGGLATGSCSASTTNQP